MDPEGDEKEWRQHALGGDAGDNDGKRDPDSAGYYAVLGVSQNASQGAIRRAFLHLSQCYHTDKHIDSSEEMLQLMKARFQKLQEAYKCLSDERQRVGYDAGGLQAVDRLALIPNSVTKREDIMRYLDILEREEEVLLLERMFSANSTSVIRYSIAHFFVPRATVPTSTPPPPPPPPPPALPAQEEDNVSGSGEAVGAGTAGIHAADSAAPANISAQLVAKELEVDGHMQIVLIPSDEIQSHLRSKMNERAVAAAAAAAAAAATNSKREQPPLHALAPAMKLILACIPREIYLHHSVQHIATRTLNVQLRTESSQKASRGSLVCTGAVTYEPDQISSYSASCGVSLNGVKVVLDQMRVLGTRWTIKGKLLLINGADVFSRYKLTLIRRLSHAFTLENTWSMSILERGFFETKIYRSLKTGLYQSLNLTLGVRRLDIYMLSIAPILYSGSEAGDQKIPRARLTQSILLAHFNGMAHVGFEAWYYITKRHHVGVGFSTAVPYTLHCKGRAVQIGRNPWLSTTNEFSLLYERGNHLIKVPIVVFVSPEVQKAVLWMVTPFVLYRVARLVWRPFQRKRTISLYRKLRLENMTEMDMARMRALLEQKAIEKAALRSHLLEESISGLVIINAKYGVLNPRYPEALHLQPISSAGTDASRPLPWWKCWQVWRRRRGNPKSPPVASVNGILRGRGGDGEEELGTLSSLLVLDVTTPLQHLVRDSKLILPSGSKSKLVGFTDPDPFTQEPKELKIAYWFQRKRHVVTLNDMDGVELPRREHLVGP